MNWGLAGTRTKNSLGYPKVGSAGFYDEEVSLSDCTGFWTAPLPLAGFLVSSEPNVGKYSSVLTILPFGTNEAEVALSLVSVGAVVALFASV
jgi:hypothetical protein